MERLRPGFTVLPRSVTGLRDGEHLTSWDHEVVRMAWVFDLDEACIHGGSQRRSRISGAQLKPCAKPRSGIVRRLIGELNAEMTTAREGNQEHRALDTRIVDRPHRTYAGDCLETADEFVTPCWTREDVDIAAKTDHGWPALLRAQDECRQPARSNMRCPSLEYPSLLRTLG